MKRIISVVIKKEIDTNPDLSYLGEFHRGNRKKFDLESFDGFWYTPFQHWPHKKENWSHVSEAEKEEVIKKYGSLKKADWSYAMEDRQRLIDYFRNVWYMIEIVAEAIVEISDDGKTWGTKKINDSIPGTESDAGKEYIEEVKKDLLATIKVGLLDMGFQEEEITVAFANATVKEC